MKSWADVKPGMVIGGHLITGETKAVLQPAIEGERVAAAQMEWERWKRANGVAAAGLRTTAGELRKLAKRQVETRDERDLERMAGLHEELAAQLDGENWLRSPKAMAELRNVEASHG